MPNVNLALNRGDKERLLQIAEEVGARPLTGWMQGQASISELVRQIASGRLCVIVSESEPKSTHQPSNEMTPERAWSFIEAFWQASGHDVDRFGTQLARTPSIIAYWPLDSDRVQTLMNS